MTMSEKEEEALILKPAEFLIDRIAAPLRLFSDSIDSLLSHASDSVRRAEQAREHACAAVHQAPFRLALLLRKLGLGMASALYVSLLLAALLLVAVAVAAVLLLPWVEEPVFLTQPLHFDYAEVHPSAIVSFSGLLGRRKRAVPVGHTLLVSVLLLMPESDSNRNIGVFQITADLISVTGEVLARSSQPCMLRFRSLPVRLAKTLLMGVPLLLGLAEETQEITVEMLRCKERNPKTEAIRVRLVPRAGTASLPELYSAELRINSWLPWRKEVVRKWKWTFYVWTSLYVYITLLVALVYWFRPRVFPLTRNINGEPGQRERSMEVVSEWQSRLGRSPREAEGSDQGSDTWRRWRRSRWKRKAPLVSEGSSASGVTREEGGGECAPSEPECLSTFHPR